MPGKKSYGPAGKWIHDRAHGIMDGRNNDLIDRYGEKRGKSIAYAIATQQAHKVKKSPKGFRTPQGVLEAKAKMSGPIKEYKKTAAVVLGDLLREKKANVGKQVVRGVMSPFRKAVPKAVKSVGSTRISPLQGIKAPQNFQQARKMSATPDPFVHQAVQRPRSGVIEKASSVNILKFAAMFDELAFLKQAGLFGAISKTLGKVKAPSVVGKKSIGQIAAESVGRHRALRAAKPRLMARVQSQYGSARRAAL
jgi:hypothetical protein